MPAVLTFFEPPAHLVAVLGQTHMWKKFSTDIYSLKFVRGCIARGTEVLGKSKCTFLTLIYSITINFTSFIGI